MEKKKYWQSFGALNDSAAFQKTGQDEFNQDLPFTDVEEKGLQESKTPRRDFLKYLGFSTTAAMVAASCEMPVRQSIPYLVKPQDIIPGEADYYATTYVCGGEAIPALAKVMDGRPIKLEGNEMSAFSKGGTSARMQASVLDLYDTARLRYPMADKKEVTTYAALDGMITTALAGLGGAPLVVLTPTVTSPTTKAVVAQLLAKYAGRHVQYDAISYSGLLQANETSYGKRMIPSYQFRNAKLVVSPEIKKMYEYAGWDPQLKKYTNPGKPVEWVKIHALPDHVYFNHSQHVTAGKIQCQTCHGPITEMDEVYQFAELSMGWCINCHRETKVQFASNKFYSIYEKFHNDLKKNPSDSITVEKIGGTECQKCHY